MRKDHRNAERTKQMSNDNAKETAGNGSGGSYGYADDFDIQTHLFDDESQHARRLRIVKTTEGQLDVYIGAHGVEPIICLSVEDGETVVQLMDDDERGDGVTFTVSGGKWVAYSA